MKLLAQPGLCGPFKHLAARVWRDLGDAHRYAHALSEDAITDYLLLDLKRRAPGQVIVNKFTRRAEGTTTGADWEWWFVQGHRGVGLRVQAKRLNVSTVKYDTLDHTIRRTRQKQINLLLRDAESCSPPLYPIYCFYNWLPGPAPAQPTVNPRCGLCSLNAFPPDVRMGVTIADAYEVAALLRQKPPLVDFAAVSQISCPWVCLVCQLDHWTGSPIPEQVLGLVSGFRTRHSRKKRTAPWPRVADALPSYVMRAIEAHDRSDGEQPVIAGDAPEGRRIDGLMVVLARERG